MFAFRALTHSVPISSTIPKLAVISSLFWLNLSRCQINVKILQFSVPPRERTRYALTLTIKCNGWLLIIMVIIKGQWAIILNPFSSVPSVNWSLDRWILNMAWLEIRNGATKFLTDYIHNCWRLKSWSLFSFDPRINANADTVEGRYICHDASFSRMVMIRQLFQKSVACRDERSSQYLNLDSWSTVYLCCTGL